MAIAEVQAALARLFTDAELRARFFDDPRGVARSLGLDPNEADGLAGLVRVDVDRFATTLGRKRLDDARKVLPLTARALGDSFAPLALSALAGPPTEGRHRDDARLIVNHLIEVGAAPPWAVDLARYELAFVAAQSLRIGLILRRFRHPIAPMIAAARGAEPSPEIRRRASFGFWLRLPGRRGLIHRVV